MAVNSCSVFTVNKSAGKTEYCIIIVIHHKFITFILMIVHQKKSANKTCIVIVYLLLQLKTNKHFTAQIKQKRRYSNYAFCWHFVVVICTQCHLSNYRATTRNRLSLSARNFNICPTARRTYLIIRKLHIEFKLKCILLNSLFTNFIQVSVRK